MGSISNDELVRAATALAGNDNSQFPTVSSSNLPDIPLEQLDYDFVNKCEDWRTLHKILLVLRSGREGRYPDLESAVEQRMVQFMPDDQRRKWEALHSKPDNADYDYAKQAIGDFVNTMGSVKQRDQSAARKLPAPRGTVKTIESANKEMAQNSRKSSNQKQDSKALPFKQYYEKWGKFDVDQELSTIESAEEAAANAAAADYKNQQTEATLREKNRVSQLKKLRISTDPNQLSKREREFSAENERQKGNDCFRAGEYENAVLYYSRSLVYVPEGAVVLCNRAQAYLKLKKYQDAEKDCTAAVVLDSSLVKAWVRRGNARHACGKYADAVADYTRASDLDPQNQEIPKLLGKSRRKYQEVEGDAAAAQLNKRRVPIEEDSESEEDEESIDKHDRVGQHHKDITSGDSASTQTSNGGVRRIHIEESDSDNEAEYALDSERSQPTIQEKNNADPAILKEEGNSAFRLGDIEGAIKKYSESLEISPNQPTLNSNRAMAYLKTHQYKLAAADCEQGLRVLRMRSTANNFQELSEEERGLAVKLLYRLGIAHRALKEFQEAISSLRAALELEPRNARLLTELQQLQSECGSDADASKVEPVPAKSSRPGRTGDHDQSVSTQHERKPGTHQPRIHDDGSEPYSSDKENVVAHSSKRISSVAAVDVASRAASNIAANAAIPSVPKSAYEFESVCNSFRNNIGKLAEYLKKIKPTKLKKLFKRPIEADTLDHALKASLALAEQGDAKLALNFMKSFSETPNFSTNAMMFGQSEKECVRDVLRLYNKENDRTKAVFTAYRL